MWSFDVNLKTFIFGVIAIFGVHGIERPLNFMCGIYIYVVI